MKLSEHFTLSEFTRTDTGLINLPDVEDVKNIQLLVDKIIEPLRLLYGKPIRISSGFRCKAVNDAVKGAKNSQHTTGEAVDLKCDDNAKLFKLIKQNFLFDQLIWEFGDHEQPAWVHVSFSAKGKNRKQILRATNKGYQNYV